MRLSTENEWPGIATSGPAVYLQKASQYLTLLVTQWYLSLAELIAKSFASIHGIWRLDKEFQGLDEH